jgi:hypothetical protein
VHDRPVQPVSNSPSVSIGARHRDLTSLRVEGAADSSDTVETVGTRTRGGCSNDGFLSEGDKTDSGMGGTGGGRDSVSGLTKETERWMVFFGMVLSFGEWGGDCPGVCRGLFGGEVV